MHVLCSAIVHSLTIGIGASLLVLVAGGAPRSYGPLKIFKNESGQSSWLAQLVSQLISEVWLAVSHLTGRLVPRWSLIKK